MLAATNVVPDDREPEWGHVFIVKAFALAGNHTSDSSLIQDGIKLATKYLDYIDTNDPHLELEIRKSRAIAFKYLGDGAKAVDDLKWVVDKRGSYDDRIQLAQAYIAGQEFTQARQLLQDIPYGDLTAGEQYDHTYAMFGLLYGTGNSDLKETVKRRLLELEPEFPYWREVRSSLLEMLMTKDENESLPSWWLSFREMVILEPNFFGLGIDLSAVIERFFLERN